MWVKGELLGDFDAAEASARGSLDRAAQSSLFDRLDWFRKLWAHCPNGRRPLIVRARAEGADAWLFLAELGEGKAQSLANWYTFAFRPVFAGDPAENTRRALLTAIARRLGSRRLGLWKILLSPVPRADGVSELVTAAFRRANWAAFATPTSASWTLERGKRSFPQYWSTRPGQLRGTLDRKSSKSNVTTQIYTEFDGAAWAQYEAVYAASWKPEEASRAFLRDLAEQEAAAGNLRLGIARIGEEPVAAQLWTVENGVALIHKLAHTETAAEHSPGTTLSHAMFRHAIVTDKVARIDFGTGDDAYKADWMEARDLLDTIELYNLKTLRGWLGAARARLGSLVRKPPLD